MSNPGSILRENAPVIYNFLTGCIRFFQKMNSPHTIYITDSLGGDFKEYISEKGLDRLKSALFKNLDEESVQAINVVCERLLYYPNEKDKGKVNKNDPIAGGLLPIETQEEVSRIDAALMQQASAGSLATHDREASVFYFYHGLTLLPLAVQNFLLRGEFADVGAYIGDSALALRKYEYSKIHSFDISEKSIGSYRRNMENAGVPESDYQLIKVALSDKDGLPDIELPDTGSAGFSLMRERGKYDPIFIKQMTFDKVADLYKINPLFIKVDIEGYGMKFVLGALNYIKAKRPVLSIAIYHNPVEFFEIKPLLESELTNYRFLIRKLTPGTKNNLCHSEVILLGYPIEMAE